MWACIKSIPHIPECHISVEEMNHPAFTFNDSSEITDANDFFCDMLKYKKDRIIGRLLFNFLALESKQIFSDYLIERKEIGDTQCCLTFRSRQSREIDTSLSIVPVYNARSASTEYFSIILDSSESHPKDSLTRMERKIFDFVQSGKTTKEIARILCLSERTVSNHRYHFGKKLKRFENTIK